jgi:hypothetical protein
VLHTKKAPQATETFKEPILPNIGSLAFHQSSKQKGLHHGLLIPLLLLRAQGNIIDSGLSFGRSNSFNSTCLQKEDRIFNMLNFTNGNIKYGSC